MLRKDELITGECYHVFNKSIAGFTIFNNEEEYSRMLDVFRYYQFIDPPYCFAEFRRLDQVEKLGFDYCLFSLSDDKSKLVEIIAYCLMPTHFHLVLRQLKDNGITQFIRLSLNSYAKYFNLKHKRLGPLWAGRFKNVYIERDEQLLHLTRYIHLNPTTAYLVKKPQDWTYSSYLEYLDKVDKKLKICRWKDSIEISKERYREFVNDRIDYQRELECIKSLILE